MKFIISMKKIRTILKQGAKLTADAYAEGLRNFENPTPEIEALARERIKDCDCLVDEPISFLRVSDPNIPELSNKMCNECGCTAAYKFRQSIVKCEKWRN